MNRPTAEFQVQFLEYIQKVLVGGSFVATYKYALLMSLADLSVEKGNDDNEALPLHARDVARKFIIYYSRQARPFSVESGDQAGILHQNTGNQAAVVNMVHEAIPGYEAGGLQSMANKLQKDKALTAKVTSTVATMPLWKLQRIGQETQDFLYEDVGHGREFELRPGIAFCFRKFHGFIYRMAQDGWVRFIRGRVQNQGLLGETSDLMQFLFGTDRSSLKPYRGILEDLQKGRCFYCNTASNVGHVDHFIPWSWYSMDLGHNFVLACAGCNSRKGDMLAAPGHLEHWLQRNRQDQYLLNSFFDERNLPHDLQGSMFVARWAYGRVSASGGPTWVRGKVQERISVEEGWGFPEGI
jgi:hypothetical protein